MLFFLIRFSKDSFDNSAHRLDAFVPPSLRIDVQSDAARASSVPLVVTGTPRQLNGIDRRGRNGGLQPIGDHDNAAGDSYKHDS